MVFGASAMVDADDVVPAGIREAGGTIRHLGMPVDPGNLLILGEIGGKPVIGAPGCARSPKENGFDWVLNRLLAGLDVTPDDITGLGVGGLLMEIVSRPQPREGGESEAEAAHEKKVAALILAAGQGRRMGGPHKLLATIDGKPLVRIAAEAALSQRGETGDGGDRPPGGQHPRGARRPRRRFRPQSRLCRRALDVAQGRHRQPAGRYRGRRGSACRHAAW